MHIRLIDSDAYTEALLDAKIAGTSTYSVTVEEVWLTVQLMLERNSSIPLEGIEGFV